MKVKNDYRSKFSKSSELDKLPLLPMCGSLAQLVEHRTGIAEVTGSNPVEALNFSGFFFPIAAMIILPLHSFSWHKL